MNPTEAAARLKYVMAEKPGAAASPPARSAAVAAAAAEALLGAACAAAARINATAADGDPEKTGKAVIALCKALFDTLELQKALMKDPERDDVEALRARLRDRLARFVAQHRSERLSGEPGAGGGAGAG